MCTSTEYVSSSTDGAGTMLTSTWRLEGPWTVDGALLGFAFLLVPDTFSMEIKH
jgi:hypothetical protein